MLCGVSPCFRTALSICFEVITLSVFVSTEATIFTTTAQLREYSSCHAFAESPLMYDFVSETTDRCAKLKHFEISAVPDLADLSTPEVSFDLHSFIESSNQAAATEEALFADILTDDSERPKSNIPTAPFVFPMPQSTGFGSDRYASEAGVKQEPAAGIETRVGTFTGRGTYAFAGLPSLSDSSALSGFSDPNDSELRSDDRKSKKHVDKASDEYRRRRERNNIAVRKSREKAKQRCKDTERRVNDLSSENDKLRKRVELLSKELSVLKNLLSNVGVPPDNIIKSME